MYVLSIEGGLEHEMGSLDGIEIELLLNLEE